MDTTSANSPPPRRSVRVLINIPLAISGTKADGTRVDGKAEAIVVNMHGAKIRTREQLTSGMRIRVALLSPYRFQMARVVRQEAEEEFSIELEQAQNFWGVYFPPDDWGTEPIPASTPGSTPTTLLGAGAQPSHPTQIEGNAPARQAERPSPSSDARSSAFISAQGTIAVVRGISAAHFPFQEKGLLVPIDSDHARILVMPLVEPGARVKVVLLPNEEMLNAVVDSLSRRRIQGKWQLVLNFASSIKISAQTEPK